jgi:hypothetical protein
MAERENWIDCVSSMKYMIGLILGPSFAEPQGFGDHLNALKPPTPGINVVGTGTNAWNGEIEYFAET